MTHSPGSSIRWRGAFLSDPIDTQELLQEVFTKIWMGAAGYDLRRRAPLAWAITITRAIKRATESACFIAQSSRISRPEPWY